AAERADGPPLRAERQGADLARTRDRPPRGPWIPEPRDRAATRDQRRHREDASEQRLSQARGPRSGRADAVRDQDRDRRHPRETAVAASALSAAAQRRCTAASILSTPATPAAAFRR